MGAGPWGESHNIGSLKRAIDLAEELIRKYPDVPEYRDELARSYFLSAAALEFKGRLEEALPYAQLAYTLRDRLAREHPHNPDFRSGLAGDLASLSRLKEYTGHPAEALELYERCFALVEAFARENPSVYVYQQRHRVGYYWRANLLNDLGRRAEALESSRKALALLEPLAREKPDDWDLQIALAGSHLEIGKVELAEGRADAALASFRRAIAIFEKLPLKSGNGFNDNMTRLYLARVRSLCSAAVGHGKSEPTAEEQAERARFADQAMESLRQAVDGGLIYPGMLVHEPEFDALRSSDNFQALIRELEERVRAAR